MLTVAIIGRPNVGKSTLFNRLTGSKHALVDDTPGVTRDRREGQGRIADLSFRLIDTAGLEEAEEASLENRMMQQTSYAVDEADVCLFVVDGRSGLTPADTFFANWIRKQNKPVILLVNKCEGHQGYTGFSEAARLGFKEIAAISAEHGEGMGDIYDALGSIQEKISASISDEEVEELTISNSKEDDKALQIAIIGRPNSGKSTLLNAFLGCDRVLTGTEAGITRDSISIDWQYKDKAVRLIDTAGLRRRSNVKQKLEKLSAADTLRAVRFSHVVLMMVDATQALEKQDLSIASHAIEEGRALVLGVNKWDLIRKRKEYLDELNYKLETQLPDIKGVPVVTLSALKNENIEKLLDAAFEAYDVWNRRIETGELNRWLRAAESQHLPPLGKNNRRIRLKYITQGNTRPPTFTLFSNLPESLPKSYARYLITSLREAFNIPGVPVRLLLRKSANPYENKKKR